MSSRSALKPSQQQLSRVPICGDEDLLDPAFLNHPPQPTLRIFATEMPNVSLSVRPLDLAFHLPPPWNSGTLPCLNLQCQPGHLLRGLQPGLRHFPQGSTPQWQGKICCVRFETPSVLQNFGLYWGKSAGMWHPEPPSHPPVSCLANLIVPKLDFIAHASADWHINGDSDSKEGRHVSRRCFIVATLELCQCLKRDCWLIAVVRADIHQHQHKLCDNLIHVCVARVIAWLKQLHRCPPNRCRSGHPALLPVKAEPCLDNTFGFTSTLPQLLEESQLVQWLDVQKRCDHEQDEVDGLRQHAISKCIFKTETEGFGQVYESVSIPVRMLALSAPRCRVRQLCLQSLLDWYRTQQASGILPASWPHPFVLVLGVLVHIRAAASSSADYLPSVLVQVQLSTLPGRSHLWWKGLRVQHTHAHTHTCTHTHTHTHTHTLSLSLSPQIVSLSLSPHCRAHLKWADSTTCVCRSGLKPKFCEHNRCWLSKKDHWEHTDCCSICTGQSQHGIRCKVLERQLLLHQDE